MRRRVRWHDRRSGSFLGSALRLVRGSSAGLRPRPWIGLSDESGRSRDGQKASAWRRRWRNWHRILYAGLAQLFRILRNARGVDRFNPVGPVATPSGYVAAVENTAPSPGRPVGTGGARAAGEEYRRQRSRPLASRAGRGSVCWAFECVLQIAWASVIVRGL